MTKEEAADSDKKAPKRRFHLFHHKHKSRPPPSLSRTSISEASRPAHSHGVTFENQISQPQDEQALTELTELLICPSKVLQTNGYAANLPPPIEAPEGEVAAERPIHPREGEKGNGETEGDEGVEVTKVCFAFACSECVCVWPKALVPCSNK